MVLDTGLDADFRRAQRGKTASKKDLLFDCVRFLFDLNVAIRPDTFLLANGQQIRTTPTLREIWTVSDEEAQLISDRASELSKRLPDKAQEILETFVTPLSCVAAIGAVLVPRLIRERELINTVKAWNAGFTPAHPAGRGGYTTAQNGNGAYPQEGNQGAGGVPPDTTGVYPKPGYEADAGGYYGPPGARNAGDGAR